MKRRIALVVPGLVTGGGVPAVAAFLKQVIDRSDRYEASFVSLATSAHDNCSVRLLAPSSWKDGIQTKTGTWYEWEYQHVGAFLTEFEFQRYRPRRLLTDILNRYDLVQIVAGTPAIALVTARVKAPTCAFVATTVVQERGSLLAELRGVRRIWVDLMTKLNAKIEIKALTTADHVFAESEYTKKLLQPIVSAPRLSVAIPGVDTSLFHPSLHEGNTKGDYILSVGRFADPRKNVRLLFAAYHQLRKRLLNAPRLVLAGKTAPTKADWQFAVDLGIAAWIDVRNNIDITELARLYRCAQLFVLSSNEEGLGMVILEAMASGLPVVSTRSGGPETAVTEEENGFLTPLGNPEILADRMYLILTNSEVRLALGMAGRRTAELRFSLDVAGQKYLKIYDGLVGVDC